MSNFTIRRHCRTYMGLIGFFCYRLSICTVRATLGPTVARGLTLDIDKVKLIYETQLEFGEKSWD